MREEQKKIIDMCMSSYRRTGAKNYRNVQYLRLIEMIDNIFRHSPETQGNIYKIGHRQVVGLWKRLDHETDKTRIEKFRILNLLFTKLNLKSPPKPKTKMEINK